MSNNTKTYEKPCLNINYFSITYYGIINENILNDQKNYMFYEFYNSLIICLNETN